VDWLLRSSSADKAETVSLMAALFSFVKESIWKRRFLFIYESSNMSVRNF